MELDEIQSFSLLNPTVFTTHCQNGCRLTFLNSTRPSETEKNLVVSV